MLKSLLIRPVPDRRRANYLEIYRFDLIYFGSKSTIFQGWGFIIFYLSFEFFGEFLKHKHQKSPKIAKQCETDRNDFGEKLCTFYYCFTGLRVSSTALVKKRLQDVWTNTSWQYLIFDNLIKKQ